MPSDTLVPPDAIKPDENGGDADRFSLRASIILAYGSQQMVRLYIPVSICMLIVLVFLQSTPYMGRSQPRSYAVEMFADLEEESIEGGGLTVQHFISALISVLFFIVFTCAMVLLFKFKCYKVIKSYLLFVVGMIFFFIVALIMRAIFADSGIFVDCISFIILIWNIGAIGICSLFWKAPLLLQQCCLIFVAAMTATHFIALVPKWSLWLLLGLLSIWDLVAVLCPKGPLRILVDLSQKREKPIFAAMIYTTTLSWTQMTEVVAADRNDNQTNPTPSVGLRKRSPTKPAMTNAREDFEEIQIVPEQSPAISTVAANLKNVQQNVLETEDHRMKLGLGDFIFFSIMVGLASTLEDSNASLACCLSVIAGLSCTIILLAIRGHSLPALPISIFLGMIFTFSTKYIMTPFTDELAINQVFI